MAQLLQWTPVSPTTGDTTTWTVPTFEPQTWNIRIKFEFPEIDDYGNCGGYIP